MLPSVRATSRRRWTVSECRSVLWVTGKEVNNMIFRLQRTPPYGRLTEVRRESGGNKPGSSYRTILRADESGIPLLNVYASDIYYQPYTVSVYRADEDALEQLRAIVERHQMTAWDDLPPDRDNIMLDGLSTDVTLVFSNEKAGERKQETVRIFYESKLPEGALDVLREFTDCLNQWATDDRLLEKRSEARR